MKPLEKLGLSLFIISLVVVFSSLVIFLFSTIKYIKTKNSKFLKYTLVFSGIFSIFFCLMISSIYLWKSYNPTPLMVSKCVIGSLGFGACFAFGVSTFFIHYYTKDIDKKVDKKLFPILIASVALFFVFFLLITDGFIDLTDTDKLIPSGYSFKEGFVYQRSSTRKNISFYALSMILGVFVVYFLADHKMYQVYNKHWLLFSTLLISVTAGLIFSRVFYVIGNWNGDGVMSVEQTFAYRVSHGEWWSVFAAWEGGITIIGGAIGGIGVGALWYKLRNRDKSLLLVMDIVVPAILIAQAIGRWGNFFNCEVHGIEMSEQSWMWLPRIVFRNAHFSSTRLWAARGNLFVPLFFIESITNLLGYFVISHLLKHKLSNVIKTGDLAFAYFIWYGTTRIFMEPLRDEAYNMGSNGYWSYMWSFALLLFGVIAIVVNHIIKNKKGSEVHEHKKVTLFSFLGAFTAVSFGLLIPGIILMATSTPTTRLTFNTFQVGLILLMYSISFILLSVLVFLSCIRQNLINLNKFIKKQNS